jgi:uncharacterized membrane protein YjjP (DUF1212 family)
MVERRVSGDEPGLHAFVLEIGRALSLAGTAVGETQQRLTRIATANGVADPRIVVLPTTLLIAFGADGRATIEPIPQLSGILRLDQISVLYGLVRRAERGEVGPGQGLRELAAIRAMRPRYRGTAAVLGHALMTVGLCLILRPTLPDVGVAGALGIAVGLLLHITRGRHVFNVLMPVLAAMLVSVCTFEAVRHGVTDPPGLRTLIAPLTTLLPGGVLTTATLELASGEMLAGASRLVSGALQLLLLAFGIVAGADLVGLARPDVLQDSYDNLLGWWAPWLGVILFGIAVSVYWSAPRGALRWLLLVLLATWVGQLAGRWFGGPAVSGFVGAFTMTPVALAVSCLPNGPPSQVAFLPAFWLLVPGAVGLIRLTEAVGDPAGAGLQDLIQPLASIIAIALGVLCGASVCQATGSWWRARGNVR